ncbi:MAG TPA: ATP-binding cassette domain-containing protein [Acidimicrobiia bacterium]|nr:ATP-binding cassette domain-containing protein [Acidimicrobiia bacterium]
MTAIVEVEGITRSFGETRALRGVDLEVHEGSVLALLGPNGAGKTTLVRILSTLIPPDGGHARVAGFDVEKEPIAVRRCIGTAGQFAAVDEVLTGRENLEMVGRLSRLSKRDAKRRAQEVLERVSLVDAADRQLKTYSGGMRRRIDLGAGLVARPRVLLLDEPTTGLDPANRLDLWAYLRDLVNEGATVLLTTQYLEEADQLARDVAVIDHGTVIAEGTPVELKQRFAGDVLDVTLASSADLERAAAALDGVGSEAPRIERGGVKVTVPVTNGVDALVEAVRRLDEASVTAADLGLRRPSLDDVFLALTGHGVDDSDGADDPDPSVTSQPPDVTATAEEAIR